MIWNWDLFSGVWQFTPVWNNFLTVNFLWAYSICICWYMWIKQGSRCWKPPQESFSFPTIFEPAKQVLLRGNTRAPQRVLTSIPCSQYHLQPGAVPLQGDLPTGAMHATLLTSVQEHRYTFQYLLYNGFCFFLVWTEFVYPPKISLFPPTFDWFPPSISLP